MGWICLSCLNEYDKSNLKLDYHDEYRYQCPSSICGDLNLVEIDDMLLPIIKLLNKKRYDTSYCCSGHSYEASRSPNTYIAFDIECVPKTLPKGFYIEDDNWYMKNYGHTHTGDSICIRKYYDNNLDEYELHKEINKTMIDLMDWAESLPDLEE